MSVLLANGIAAALFFIASVILLVVIGFVVSGINRYSETKDVVGVLFLVGLLAVSLTVFGWSATHRVIEPNNVGIIVDRSNGSPLLNTYSAGVVHVGFTQQLYTFPAQKDYQWCPELTPSVKGGAEVTITVCVTLDAKNVPWFDQYTRFNGDVSVIQDGWTRKFAKTTVSNAISTFEPNQLTNERPAVEQAISLALKPYFDEMSITISNVNLYNWRFSDPDVQASYEAAQLSVAKVDAAKNEYAAAQIQSETADLRKQSCSNAGFSDQAICLQFLQLEWLRNIPELPANFILNLGGSTSPSFSVPVATPVTNP